MTRFLPSIDVTSSNLECNVTVMLSFDDRLNNISRIISRLHIGK